MRNPLDSSSAAQGLDGERLTGSLLPHLKTLSAQKWLRKRPVVVNRLPHEPVLLGARMGTLVRQPPKHMETFAIFGSGRPTCSPIR